MSEVKVMQVLAECAYTLHCPISETSAFGQNQVPNLGCTRYDAFDGIIRDLHTPRKIQHTKMLEHARHDEWG